jgi:hypothetical protein
MIQLLCLLGATVWLVAICITAALGYALFNVLLAFWLVVLAFIYGGTVR